MRNTGFRGQLLTVLALAWTTVTANAGFIDSVEVNVNGIDYIANFVVAPSDLGNPSGNSFNGLWDGNRNGDLTDDGDLDLYDTLPTFWNDLDGALSAAEAIVAALGRTDWLSGPAVTRSDAFVIPVLLGASETFIWHVGDRISNPFTDRVDAISNLRNTRYSARTSWVNFELANRVAVPAPPTWLLICVGVIAAFARSRRLL